MNYKRFLFGVVLLGFIYALVEGGAALCLLVLEKRHIVFEPLLPELQAGQVEAIERFLDRESSPYHPTLGWTNEPNSSVKSYQCNAQGIRAIREISPTISDSSVRVSAFGDSFTFGAEVTNDETWVEQMNATGPVDVVNFGVRAYGFDQAYLRYLEDGVRFESDIVFMGFMSENIYRNVNVYRMFYKNAYQDIFSKPRFALVGDRVELLENPLSTKAHYRELLEDQKSTLASLGQSDFHYQIRYKQGPFDFLPSVRFAKILSYYFQRSLGPGAVERFGYYNRHSDAYRATLAIFRDFRQAALDNGALPIAVIFPNWKDLKRYMEDGTVWYQPLLEDLQEEGFQVIDLAKAFEAHKQRERVRSWFQRGLIHYSPRGNRIVADYLLDYLDQHRLLTRDAVLEVAELR